MKRTFNKRWQIIEELNHGGQGTVFKVKDLTSDIKYALKLIRIKKYEKKKLKRIQTEIEIIKQLKNSKNIVKIYDDNLQEAIDEKTQEVFYVMDYTPYGSLKNNNFYFNDVETSLRIFREILIGVNQAHKANIIHRDLKPENVLLYPTQRDVMISDFGIGRMKERIDEEGTTDEEEILGPRYFISPEQFKDPSNADEKSDIYSLGKILLYLLTGKGRIFREEVGDLASYYEGENPYLPLIQENLLIKMITEDRDKRFNDVKEIIDEVNIILEKLSENSKRYLQRQEKGPRIYDLFIGSQRQEFIKNFTSDIMLNLRMLEWSLEDLNKEKKEGTAEKLLTELNKAYTEDRVSCAIQCVNLFINNPKQLKDLDKKHETISFPSFFLHKYFYNAGSYKISHQYLEKALELEKDPEIVLAYLLHFSNICKNCTCELKHNFEERIKKLLRETSDNDAKNRLYKILGEHFIEIKDQKRGLIFLEAYLDRDPHNEDIRFKCAFQYSELGELESSLYHYLVALNNAKDISMVTNNLGVLYYEKNMPVKGMAMYEKSYKLGNTLAGSNLASEYLKIGLKDKASGLLRTIIRENKSYNERVDVILGNTHQTVKDEDRLEKDLNKSGMILSNYHTEYVEQLTSPQQYAWEGFWEINNKYVIQIKKLSEGLSIEATNNTNIEIQGVFEGNCLNIKQIILNKDTYSFGDKYNEGFIYLQSDHYLKGYSHADYPKKLFEIKGVKIEDIERYREQHKSSRDALVDAILQNPS